MLVYSHPSFKTLFLKRFLATSALKYPEDFNQKLLTELFSEGRPVLAGIPMLLLFNRDSKDSTTLEWLAPIKPLVRSSLAVIRLSDPGNERQEIFFRYCEENGHSQSAVCIIEPHPTMNRYLLSGQIGDKNLRLFVQDWAEQRISPYLKVENVVEKRIGNVQVGCR